MTDAENMQAAGAHLMQAVKLARTRSRWLHANARRAIVGAAETEENVAGTLDRLAGQQPHRAERLNAMSRDARRHAALAWRRAGITLPEGRRRDAATGPAAPRNAVATASAPEPSRPKLTVARDG